MVDRHRNSLSLRERGKQVPWTASHPRRAFKRLKGCPSQLAALAHLDPALRGVVEAINAPGTGLFSVASAGGSIERGHDQRHSGYVEFALNSQLAVQQAANYCSAFLLFNRWLHFHRFERAAFQWELEETDFTEVGVSGFACSVIVTTDWVDSAAAARSDWERALTILGQYFGTFRGPEDDPIYESSETQSLNATSANNGFEASPVP